jgi:hypothetical protein
VFGMKIAGLTLAVSLAISAFWYVGSLRDRVGEQDEQIDALQTSLQTSRERVADRETARAIAQTNHRKEIIKNAEIIRQAIANGDSCANAPVPVELRQ